jgi:adenylate cyclase
MNDSLDQVYAERGEQLLGSAEQQILTLLNTIAGGDYPKLPSWFRIAG